MKNIVAVLFIVFILGTNVFADERSENYLFLRDLIDCLYRLNFTSRYVIKDIAEETAVDKLHAQIPYLQEAKVFMQKWLECETQAIKATAMEMYVNITQVEQAVKNLVAVFSAQKEDYLDEITKYSLQESQAWNNMLESTGLSVWVIMHPAKSENPQGAIPFIISDEERQNLIIYLYGRFGREFKDYKSLRGKKEMGETEDIEMTIPVWAALQLRSLLVKVTYEQAMDEDFFDISR